MSERNRLRREIADARRLLERLDTDGLEVLLEAGGDGGPWSSILARLIREELGLRDRRRATAQALAERADVVMLNAQLVMVGGDQRRGHQLARRALDLVEEARRAHARARGEAAA